MNDDVKKRRDCVLTYVEDMDDPNDALLNGAVFGNKKELVSRLTQIDFNLTFDLINTSHSQLITVAEITQLFKSLGAQLSDQQIQSLMDVMGENGHISREEFILLMNSNSNKVN